MIIQTVDPPRSVEPMTAAEREVHDRFGRRERRVELGGEELLDALPDDRAGSAAASRSGCRGGAWRHRDVGPAAGDGARLARLARVDGRCARRGARPLGAGA
ncbi:hypothetical protein [Agromyces ramosus]|uniref:Uncharacterized protein n=1 Tax=Agromyces ramosus TaxID=33879 RepID=A0ABU0R5G3_9MICO|nr:hypothetical protein [Agromyces ramosus]MDQ0893328.1 hypothetical protein [Agromyces ramosus]